ncbi:MAG: hypothetical protein IPJ39_22085 [Saprospiraceae bacterium]|nr:hypothetical protein [Saprospiraceae bacterium]
MNQQTDIFGEKIEENNFANVVDNIFRHVIINGEFLLGRNENLRLRVGYNHLRRKELSLNTFRSLAGYSLGLGIQDQCFQIGLWHRLSPCRRCYKSHQHQPGSR